MCAHGISDDQVIQISCCLPSTLDVNDALEAITAAAVLLIHLSDASVLSGQGLRWYWVQGEFGVRFTWTAHSQDGVQGSLVVGEFTWTAYSSQDSAQGSLVGDSPRLHSWDSVQGILVGGSHGLYSLNSVAGDLVGGLPV